MDSLHLGLTSALAQDSSLAAPYHLTSHPPCPIALGPLNPLPPARRSLKSPSALVRKRKIEFPMEEFAKRAALMSISYDGTINEAHQFHATFPGQIPSYGSHLISSWQQPDQSYYVEEMDDDDFPNDIQMAEEAG
ncbi:hypothetical protein CDL15_Pgr000307 [Punica granatum]|uniref:Uncharacterized protein n=1 Tax=Punica granatum TaxID=22663 RepID=A0A218Y264_PUNGR|nr:hypothetical protein CDL15_Pgr000307 [Punica granatum]